VSRRVTMGLLFYPRGGSAQVIRYLAAALDGAGWRTEVFCGSLGAPGERTNAAGFFAGLDVRALDYGPAVAAHAAGRDPIAEPVPMHPSFEDRAGVPDRIFAAVSPELGDHLVDAWVAFLSEGLDHRPELLHLHHLSPLQEACRHLFPDVPLVTHLHGTELKMIDRIDRLVALAGELDTDLAGMADRAEAGDAPGPADVPAEHRELAAETRWEMWRHGEHWAKRLRATARDSDRFIVISPHDRSEAERLLDISGEHVTWIPNGVDTDLFARADLEPEERVSHWRHWLVEEPLGWDESGEPGSIAYEESDLEAFAPGSDGTAPPVLLFAGRFLDFKRVPLLVRAYAAARERFERPAPLVIWGGFPGEWEGEHPHAVARELGLEREVFFVGWRGHSDLAQGLTCADVMVAPSQNEPFGQVFLEAMACGLPVIATRSGGPMSFVNTEEGAPNGWMVGVDDQDQLAGALVEAVNDGEGRSTRSRNAYEQVRAGYSWRGLVSHFVDVYGEALSARAAP
jgi:D-inositol-3-phosphate glycosyltransferase